MPASHKSRGKKRRRSRIGRVETVKSTNRFLRFLYMVGIQTVRILKRFKRRLGRFLAPVANLFRHIHYTLFGKRLEQARAERARIKQGFSIARKRMELAKRRGFFSPVAEFFKISGRSVVRHKRMLVSFLNVIAPAAAAVVLIATINYFNSMSYGLLVQWGDAGSVTDIAYVKSEEVYGSAAQLLDQRVVDETAESKNMTPRYTLAILEDQEELSTPGTVCNKLIEEMSDSYVEACGLYVEGQLVGAVPSAADMKFVLQGILNKEKGSDAAAKASFTKDVQLMDGLYASESLTDTGSVKEKLTSQVQEEQRATVKKNDTGSKIAKRYGMTVEDLRDLNPDLDFDKLKEGQEIKVAKPRTYLTVKLTKEEKRTETLPYSTVTLKDDKKYTSYSEVTQKGSSGEVEYTDSVTYVDGVEVARKNVSKATLKEPVNQRITVGTKKQTSSSGKSGSSKSGNSGSKTPDSTQKPTGRFIWPAPNVRVISSGFKWRWGRQHAGIDIANGKSRGNRVVASDAGKVTVKNSGSRGYGLHVIITHSNGFSTLYGHLMSVSVSSGQRVSQGQTIGKIGNSGASQGNHLHFEIRINGKAVNPRNYVSP